MAAPQTISGLMVRAFDRALHAVPQHGSMLKDTVRVVTGVGAEDYRFHALGKALARTRAALQPIQASPTIKAKPLVKLELKEHYEFLDDWEAARLSVSAMAGYGRNSRLAVERACDQWIIEAMTGTLNTGAINSGISRPGSAETMNLDNITKRYTALLKKGVGSGDMLTFAYGQTHFTNIVGINELISRDYSAKGMIATGRPPPLFGMQWRGIEDRVEGGFADDEGVIYAKNGLGLVMGDLAKMRDISWRNDLNAWQIGARITGEATAIDKDMIAQGNWS